MRRFQFRSWLYILLPRSLWFWPLARLLETKGVNNGRRQNWEAFGGGTKSKQADTATTFECVNNAWFFGMGINFWKFGYAAVRYRLHDYFGSTNVQEIQRNILAFEKAKWMVLMATPTTRNNHKLTAQFSERQRLTPLTFALCFSPTSSLRMVRCGPYWIRHIVHRWWTCFVWGWLTGALEVVGLFSKEE